jgi:hypothetical protein
MGLMKDNSAALEPQPTGRLACVPSVDVLGCHRTASVINTRRHRCAAYWMRGVAESGWGAERRFIGRDLRL